MITTITCVRAENVTFTIINSSSAPLSGVLRHQSSKWTLAGFSTTCLNTVTEGVATNIPVAAIPTGASLHQTMVKDADCGWYFSNINGNKNNEIYLGPASNNLTLEYKWWGKHVITQ